MESCCAAAASTRRSRATRTTFRILHTSAKRRADISSIRRSRAPAGQTFKPTTSAPIICNSERKLAAAAVCTPRNICFRWAIYWTRDDPNVHRSADFEVSSSRPLSTWTQNDNGAIYLKIITGTREQSNVSKIIIHDRCRIEPNFQVMSVKIVDVFRVNLMWQSVQIIIMTISEVLFSVCKCTTTCSLLNAYFQVTSMELAYTQSAPSVKALATALYLCTSTLGSRKMKCGARSLAR